jgi:predicted ABC-type transport system involved in lysophospholipase L1 biosynthesis ATPase subunit
MSSPALDEQIIRRGLAALPQGAIVAITHALDARDWGAVITILRTVLADLDERRAALRDRKIALTVQAIELEAQEAALAERQAAFANRRR